MPLALFPVWGQEMPIRNVAFARHRNCSDTEPALPKPNPVLCLQHVTPDTSHMMAMNCSALAPRDIFGRLKQGRSKITCWGFRAFNSWRCSLSLQLPSPGHKSFSANSCTVTAPTMGTNSLWWVHALWMNSNINTATWGGQNKFWIITF